jgi:hypothetical protein
VYKLPADLDLTMFVGRTVDALTFTENTVHFVLSGDDDLSITVEGETLHELEAGGIYSETVPATETRLVQLLGRTVTRASSEGDVTLRLEFEGGHTVRIIGESDLYEMYRITFGSREIIV